MPSQTANDGEHFEVSKFKLSGLNETVFSSKFLHLGFYSLTGCSLFGIIYSFKSDLFYKPNWGGQRNDDGSITKRRGGSHDNSNYDSDQNNDTKVISPELIEYRRIKEKLLRKIDEIKDNRAQNFRRRLRMSNELESVIKQRKEELMSIKDPAQTVQEYRREQVLLRKEQNDMEIIKRKVFFVHKQKYVH